MDLEFIFHMNIFCPWFISCFFESDGRYFILFLSNCPKLTFSMQIVTVVDQRHHAEPGPFYKVLDTQACNYHKLICIIFNILFDYIL